MNLFLGLFFGALAVVLAVVLYLTWTKLRRLTSRFSRVIDIDQEVKTRRTALERLQDRFAKLQADVTDRTDQLNADYREKRAVYERLLREISILEESLEFTDVGLYKPHYDFDTSEKYKAKLEEIRARQKDLIRGKTAVVCRAEWSVEGSKAKGRKMTNQYSRLMLRAFNGESDAAVLKVKWNNITRMEERLKKAYDTVNALGSTYNVDITGEYRDLKLEELRLAHELQQKLYDEKEEQRRIREQMREEERARQEIEKAQRDAAAEEKRYGSALEKARSEVADAHGAKLEKLKTTMAELEKRLEEARQNKERALSRAQLTKSGHVYIISNVGSFGEDVFKIGMTRRLEPIDRVKELGDASVPFAFDVHAMIYSENAPDLETTLHREFDPRRINLSNQRKEFFRVSLEDIEKAVHAQNADIEFTKLAEAREYRETLALLQELANKKTLEEKVAQEFPETL